MKVKEFTMYFPDAELRKFGIQDTFELWRDAAVSRINILSCNGGNVYGTVSVENEIDEESDEVDQLEVFQSLGENRQGFTYLFELSAPDIGTEADGCPTELFCEGELAITDRGIELTGIAPQSVICLFHEELRSRKVSFEVQQITDYTGKEGPAELLTERQREVLRCAYEMGYFNVPRNVTMSDIAEQFQLDKSTISEHLQRAERKILSNFC